MMISRKIATSVAALAIAAPSVAAVVAPVADAAAAAAQVDEMCRRLLANPVIEAYDVEISEVAPA